VENEIEQVCAPRRARGGQNSTSSASAESPSIGKSNSIDLVTEADRESEAAIIELIHRAFPTHAILAEESGASAHQSDHRWIIDPLDGTTNFAHATRSSAYRSHTNGAGVVEFGVVFDSLRKECFIAQRGRGARLNGQADSGQHDCRVSAPRCSAPGFRTIAASGAASTYASGKELMTRVQGVRRTGSAALDLVYVAAGRTDGFWEFGLKAWDIAAGALIVNEARAASPTWTVAISISTPPISSRATRVSTTSLSKRSPARARKPNAATPK